MRILATYILILAMALPSVALSQPIPDSNGDGIISILSFGDSLTFGVGDGTSPGAFVEEAARTDGTLGYPSRLVDFGVGVVRNAGVPGEELTQEGINRVPSVLLGSDADYIVILEGTNDSFFRRSSGEVRSALQQAVNVSRALGFNTVLMTLPPPCCDRASLAPFISIYNLVIREVAFANELPLADLETAWLTTCQDPISCELYNLPEGLHPNSLGYDVISQVALAAIAGVDIFSENGAVELESLFGLEPGTVIVEPTGVIE